MKIRMLRNVDADVDKTKYKEVWPKYLYKNDVLSVSKIEQITDKHVNLVLDDGDVLLEIQSTSFELM
jgi:hypothetical protein